MLNNNNESLFFVIISVRYFR